MQLCGPQRSLERLPQLWAQAASDQDSKDLSLNVVQPDFTIINLPTTLRLEPANLLEFGLQPSLCSPR